MRTTIMRRRRWPRSTTPPAPCAAIAPLNSWHGKESTTNKIKVEVGAPIVLVEPPEGKRQQSLSHEHALPGGVHQNRGRAEWRSREMPTVSVMEKLDRSRARLNRVKSRDAASPANRRDAQQPLLPGPDETLPLPRRSSGESDARAPPSTPVAPTTIATSPVRSIDLP